MPEIRTSNQEAWEVWSKCRRQYLMAMGGPIDINHLAVWRMIDERKIENRMDCFDRVCRFADFDIAAFNLEHEAETKKK